MSLPVAHVAVYDTLADWEPGHLLAELRTHTSAAAEYLAASGYAGGQHYVDARAVNADGVITAGPDSPVQFAATTLSALGLLDDEARKAYEALFSAGDPAAYPVLMAAGDAAESTS